jgi:hypothetical protein
MQSASEVKPLVLSPAGSSSKWWSRDYDAKDVRNIQRMLFSVGPGPGKIAAKKKSSKAKAARK